MCLYIMNVAAYRLFTPAVAEVKEPDLGGDAEANRTESHVIVDSGVMWINIQNTCIM